MELEVTEIEDESGQYRVSQFLEDLLKKNKELYELAVGLIENLRFPNYRVRPFTKSLGDGLYEIRPKTINGACRIFYCISRYRKVVLLEGWMKQDKKRQNRIINKLKKQIKKLKNKKIL